MQNQGKHLLITLLLHDRQHTAKLISQMPASNTYKDLAQYLISQSNESSVLKKLSSGIGS